MKYTGLRNLVITAFLGMICYGAILYVPGNAAPGAPVYSTGPFCEPNLAPVSTSAPVKEWNLEAARLTLLPSSALSPVQQTRVMAIAQVAVHDAVNGITGEFATYSPMGPAPANASAEASAVAAAHQSLRELFSAHAGNLDLKFEQSLTAYSISPLDPGIEYGRAAATAILAARANDLSAQAQYDYTPPDPGEPGAWIRLNNAAALLPGWGNVTPFVMRSGDQFRPDAPPNLSSEIYAQDYNEIKKLGRSTDSTRTLEQTEIASFWRASPTAIWNPVMQQALEASSLDISSTARAFALFYLASGDASISCWETKYHYNFWRPQLAIRGGDLDGNDLTVADRNWTPLFGTPPHPEYASGHTTNSSAMASVLEDLFGSNPGMTFSVTLAGITRQWSTFDQAVEEVIDARIYSGLHFRTADEVGARQGRQVAQFVMQHALKPCRGMGNRC